MTAERIAGSSAIDNPTFLSVDAVSGVIYANAEVFGWHEGTTSAFAFDAESKTLPTISGDVASHAADIHPSEAGRFLYVKYRTI